MIITSYDGTEMDQALAILEEALMKLKAEAGKVQQQLNSVIPRKQSVEPCNRMGKLGDIDSYTRSGYGPTRWQDRVQKARLHADELLAKSKAIHEKNAPAIQSNEKACEVLRQVASAFGFPGTYTTYKYKTSRSRSKTKETHISGWVSDMSRWLIVYDGWEQAQRDYDRFIKDIDKYEKKHLADDAAEERKEQAKLAELKNDRALAVLIGKYGCDITASANDVLTHILERDKYLRLAHYMLANRNDWSESYSLAECGLSGFNVENEQDEAIYDGVSSYMWENWDGDGRVFRDSEWNYERVFALVDDDVLMEDYNTVSAMIEM